MEINIVNAKNEPVEKVEVPESIASAEPNEALIYELVRQYHCRGKRASGTCESRAAIHIPLIAMIRPRAGGFCYSAGEFNVMQRDAETALAEGADGIAFGILTAQSRRPAA